MSSSPQQYVTLVGSGGTPVRLADAKGRPFPTTGTGALVFNRNPTIYDAILVDPVIQNGGGGSLVAVSTFAAISEILFSDVPPAAIVTAGYYVPGDEGAATYTRSTSEPAVPSGAKFQLGDYWYRLAMSVVNPTMLGGQSYAYDPNDWALGSAVGKTDSYTAIAQCIEYATRNGAVISAPGRIYVSHTFIVWATGFQNHVGFFAIDLSLSSTTIVNSGKNLMVLAGAMPTVVGTLTTAVAKGDNFIFLPPSALGPPSDIQQGSQVMLVNDQNMISQSANFARNCQHAEVREIDLDTGRVQFDREMRNSYRKSLSVTNITFSPGVAITNIVYGLAITNLVWAAGIVTATTAAAHGYVDGDVFSTSGTTPSSLNGSHTATTGTTGSTLKWAQASNPGTITVNGVVDGVITATTSAPHGYVDGDTFYTSSIIPTILNGQHTAIVGSTGSTLKWARTTNPGAVTANGVVDGIGTATCVSASGITDGQDFYFANFAPAAYNAQFEAVAGSNGVTLKWHMGTTPAAVTQYGIVDYRPRLLLLDPNTRMVIDDNLVVYGAGGSPAGESTVFQRALYMQLCFGNRYNNYTVYNCERGGWIEDSCIGLRGQQLYYHGCSNWYLSAYGGSFSGCQNYDMGDIWVSRCRHGHTSNSGSVLEDFGEWWSDDGLGGGDATGLGMWAGLVDTHSGVGITKFKKIVCLFNTDATEGSSVAAFAQGGGFQFDSLHVYNGKSAAVGFQPYGCRIDGYKLSASISSVFVDGSVSSAVFAQNLSDRDLGGTSQDMFMYADNVSGTAATGYRASPSEGNTFVFGHGGALTVTENECIRAVATEDFISEVRVSAVKFEHLSVSTPAIAASATSYLGTGLGAAVWLSDGEIVSLANDTTASASGPAQINLWNTPETVTGTVTHSTSGAGVVNASSVGTVANVVPGATFLPAVSFTVPGTGFSVVYTARDCVHQQMGEIAHVEIRVAGTMTYDGTSSGALRVSLPYQAGSPARTAAPVIGSNGFTWGASHTQLVASNVSDQSYVNLIGSGSGVASSAINATNFTSGVAFEFIFSLDYTVR